jgi:PKD domain
MASDRRGRRTRWYKRHGWLLCHMVLGVVALLHAADARAVQCNLRCGRARLPSSYTLGRLRTLLSQEKVTSFKFPADPELGVYVYEAYIAASSVNVADSSGLGKAFLDAAKLILPSGTFYVDIDLNGNDRPAPMALAAPDKNKVLVVLDFVKGEGFVVAEATKVHFRVRQKTLLWTKTWYTKTQTLSANTFSVNSRGDDSWLLANWADPDTFRLRVHGLVAAPGNAEHVLASAIDHQVLINRRSGEMRFEGDAFPSVVATQINCSGQQIQRLVRTETNPTALSGNRSFSHPQYAYQDPPHCDRGSPKRTRPPSAHLALSATRGLAPLTVRFDGSGSTSIDGTIDSYLWKFGDGARTGAPSGSHVYQHPGIYKLELRVTDSVRRKGWARTYVEVLQPPVNRGPDVTGWWPDEGSVTATNQPRLAVWATDPDGDPLAYNFRVDGEGVALATGWISASSWQVPPFKLDPGTPYTWSFRAKDDAGHETEWHTIHFRTQWMPVAAEMVATPDGEGYWTTDTGGTVRTFGNAPHYGSLRDVGISAHNIIGIARTADGGGYWLVGSDGGVFSFGDAKFYGSMGGRPLNGPVVAMSPTRDGRGYWLATSDGGVFAFGNAPFKGSMGGQHLNAPVVGLATRPDADGYWLVAKDGGVFSFGATFYGSMGGQHLNAPVTDMAVHPSGRGYWLVAEDGGVFSFGAARFHGSLGGRPLNGRITSMEATPDGGGYWLLGCDGGLFTFGNARFFGSAPVHACRGS